MSEDLALAKEIAELKRRLAELEKKQSAQEPLRPRMNMPKIDYTENFRLPADAAQAMAAVVPDVKGKGYNEHAWSQTKMYGPSGFGPDPKRMAEADREARRKDQEKEAKRRAEAETKDVRSAIERQLAATGWRNKPGL